MNQTQHKKQVLIIEDETEISHMLKHRLNFAGYGAYTAADGQEGLNHAKATKPHLIILDLKLPKLSGEQVLKTLRAYEDNQLANTPIIILTAKDDDIDRLANKSLGANVYLTKPFDPKILMKHVHRF